jgi:hypothetical protein
MRFDALVVFWLEGISDKIEEQYGRAVAWWATLAMCLSVLGVVGGVLYLRVR